MITLKLDKTKISVLSTEQLTNGSKNIYTCKFSFDEDWEGLERTAFFQAGSHSRKILLDSENSCQIPHEVLAAPGKNLYVGVRGTRGGELVLPSRMANLGYIHIGADSAEFTEPSPDAYGQILSFAREALSVAQSVRDDANNGEFNGDSFTYDDFTSEQLAELKGDPFTYEDFTEEQLEELKGAPFTYEDFTEGQLEELSGKDAPTIQNVELVLTGDVEEGLYHYRLCPSISVPYAPTITVQSNVETNISTLEGACEISLVPAEEGWSNEWIFVVSQGEIAYDVVLPEIDWPLGIAPAFGANSLTEVRLHYKGDTLQGVWNE